MGDLSERQAEILRFITQHADDVAKRGASNDCEVDVAVGALFSACN